MAENAEVGNHLLSLNLIEVELGFLILLVRAGGSGICKLLKSLGQKSLRSNVEACLSLLYFSTK